MGVDHYENFPVASLLVPSRLRPGIKALYRFARTADDFADEGEASPDARVQALQHYRDALTHLAEGRPASTLPTALQPVFVPLEAAILTHGLSLTLLDRLLTAFMQDVTQHRHPDFASLLAYCACSANPVGRLLLQLYGHDRPALYPLSDALCTALQLINFWQDVAVDWEKGRVYLPMDSLIRFGVDERQIAQGRVDAAWKALMGFEVARARSLMHEGWPLVHALPGRLGWELRLVALGGLRILERIEAVDYDVFRQRPTLSKADWLRMTLKAAFLNAPNTRP